MGSPKAGRQGIDARFLAEGDRFFRVRIDRAGSIGSTTLPGGQGTQFRFHAAVVGLRHGDSLFCIGQVLFIGQRAAIVHDAGEPDLQSFLHVA